MKQEKFALSTCLLARYQTLVMVATMMDDDDLDDIFFWSMADKRVDARK